MSHSSKKSGSKHSRMEQAVQSESAFRPAYAPNHGRKSSGASYMDTEKLAGQKRGNADARTGKKKHKVRNVILCVLLVVLILTAVAGTAFALYMNQINNAIQVQDDSQAAAIDEVLSPTVSDEPFYMMVIGSDSRHDDFGQRSDSNIVARIDPSTATVTLISIPRDTAIDIDGNVEKFNAAYNYDGASGAIREANDLLGIKISHYVEIDFSGLVDLIDAVGGVEVDVPMRIEDADAGGTVEAGQQTLDGEHALVFARSRSYTTGDFQRSANQRILVEGFVEKVLSLPPTELPSLVTKAANCISTDLSLTDIVGYLQKFQEAGDITMYSAMIPSGTADHDGVSYVVCDVSQLTKMMEVVNAGGDPSTVIQDSSITSSEEAEALGESGIPVYVETDVAAGLIPPQDEQEMS